MSGTPTSTEWAMDYQGYMPFGRGDQERTPFLWFANFYVEYNLKLGKNNLNINLNVDNVFDIKTAQRIYPIYNQGAVAISDSRRSPRAPLGHQRLRARARPALSHGGQLLRAADRAPRTQVQLLNVS